MISGLHFRVGVQESALSVRFNVSENGTVINPTPGFEYILLTTLASVLNFSYTLVDNNKIPYGRKDENGSWIGTVALVARGELDLALSMLAITPDRMKVVDFTPSYTMDQVSFFIKSQTMAEKKGIFFTEPFAIGSWILLFVFLITYAIILQALLKPRCNLNVVTFVLANILEQGYNLHIPKNHRHKISIAILLIFWFLTSTIILIHYDTFLTSSASLHDDLDINTLKQLMPYFARGEMKIGTKKGTSVKEWTARILNARQYQETLIFGDFDTLVEPMLQGKLAILASVEYFKWHMHESGVKEKYHLVKEWVYYENIAMPLRKNFTYKKEFGRIINVLKATGCLEKWETDLTSAFQINERKNELSEKEGYSPINSEDFDSAFILCFGGLLICFLIFNAERAIKKYSDKRIIKISDN